MWTGDADEVMGMWKSMAMGGIAEIRVNDVVMGEFIEPCHSVALMLAEWCR